MAVERVRTELNRPGPPYDLIYGIVYALVKDLRGVVGSGRLRVTGVRSIRLAAGSCRLASRGFRLAAPPRRPPRLNAGRSSHRRPAVRGEGQAQHQRWGAGAQCGVPTGGAAASRSTRCLRATSLGFNLKPLIRVWLISGSGTAATGCDNLC